jgi:uncharacterized protein YegP (UPF0339 family)
MTGNTIEIYEDAAGDYRWRHRMCGEIIAASSEGYENESDCWDAAWTVKSLRVFDTLAAQHTLEWYIDTAGEYRWRLRHDNGNIIATAGEGYADRRTFSRDMAAFVDYAHRAEMVDTTTDADSTPPATVQ